MTRSKIALTAILLTALVPALALAGPGDGPRQRGRFGPGFGPGADGPRGGHFLPPPGYLDLSEEQIEATRAIRDGVRDETGALRDQQRALRRELDAALDVANPDPATVGQLVIDMHVLRPQLRSILESAEAEFAAILNEQQLQKWENWKELRLARRGDRGERRRHRERRGFGPRPGLDGPGLDGPGLDGPGLDGPGLDGPGPDGPGAAGPGFDS